MIDDLLFKGKSLEEALGKASNFYGIEKEIIKYEFHDDAPQGAVWIVVTENPILAQRKTSSDPDSIGNSVAGHTTMSSHHVKSDNRRRPIVSPSPSRDRKPEPRNQSRPKRENVSRPNNRPETRRDTRPNNRSDSRPDNRRDNPARPRNDRRPVNNSPAVTNDPNWSPQEFDLGGMNDLEKQAYVFLTGVIVKMKVQVQVEPIRVEDRLIFDIGGPDRGLLLQQKGETLISLQYLTNKIFLRRDLDQNPVYIDSQGYRSARDQELADIALMSAEKVKSSGQEYNLNPMNPYERRMIHITLKNVEGVATVSRGGGYIKKVSIVPAK
jgi:spoIIIJ-associated protein